jgi:penicillin-binding protein 1A
VIYDAHANQTRRQVFQPSTAWLTVNMMKDVVSSGTGTAAKLSGQTVAGKTGTNSDQKGVFFAGLTGWYCGTVWIGHDNYKALSSKTTGGNSAAKLWKAFMQPIHRNLSNRDIMEGSASDYGLVRVTTCNVSGQLATDACRHDAMGYGTTTDYWPASSAPTVSCQMHYTLDVCDQTGMLATSYCPSHSTKGVVMLPIGHPLYEYADTAYAGVLADYLGEYAAMRLTADGNINAALLQSRTCSVHQSYSSGYEQTIIDNTLLPDAQRLLAQAQNQLAGTPEDQYGYAGLRQAITQLNDTINSNPTSAALAAAMANLTQAMANARGSW